MVTAVPLFFFIMGLESYVNVKKSSVFIYFFVFYYFNNKVLLTFVDVATLCVVMTYKNIAH